MGLCLLNLLTMVPEKVATGFSWLSLAWTVVRIWVMSLVVLRVDHQESGEV